LKTSPAARTAQISPSKKAGVAIRSERQRAILNCARTDGRRRR
jgi:hypothetical protein